MTGAAAEAVEITAGKGLKSGTVTRKRVSVALSEIVEVKRLGKGPGRYNFLIRMRDGSVIVGEVKTNPTGRDSVTVRGMRASSPAGKTASSAKAKRPSGKKRRAAAKPGLHPKKTSRR